MSGLGILQIALAVYLVVLVPYYWRIYGAANFLWFSDIGLFLTALGIWFQSPLLISMVMIGIFPLEMLWAVDYFVRLLTGRKLFGITDYMFNPQYSKFLRALSYFHIFVPVICVWYLFAWGYDPLALPYQIILNTIILISCYLFTLPKENINWVFMPAVNHWQRVTPLLWLVILLVGVPVLIIWPLHCLFSNMN